MPSLVVYPLIVLLSTLLNRFRGGGYWSDKIPVKALWIAAPLYAALPLLLTGLTLAGVYTSVVFIFAYLVWALPPWGRWLDLGRLYGNLSSDREFSKYEDIIEEASRIINRFFRKFIKQHYPLRWFDRVAMYLRHTTMLIPGFLLISLCLWNFYYILGAFVLGFILLMCYEIAWLLWDNGKTLQPISIAEHLSGFVWGLLIILLA